MNLFVQEKLNPSLHIVKTQWAEFALRGKDDYETNNTTAIKKSDH